MVRKLVFAAVALLAGAALAGPAAALDRETQTVSVFYGDLNLDNPAGAAVLYSRFERAAVQACGGQPSGRTALMEQRGFRDCVAAAMEDAVSRLDRITVTALYMERTGQSIQLAHGERLRRS